MLSCLFDKLFKRVGVSGRENNFEQILQKNSFIIVSRINGERFTDWKKKRENEMDGGDDKCLVGVQEESC